jgi:hypothetical protein
MSKLIIFIIIIIILLCLFWSLSRLFSGNISNTKEYYLGNCDSCDGKTLGQCMLCLNCGFTSKNGYGKCVPGDQYGPFEYNKDYVNGRWSYGDDYWNNATITDDIAIPTTSVYSNRYPYYRRWFTKRLNGLKKIKYNNRPNYLKKLPNYTRTMQKDASGITVNDDNPNVRLRNNIGN